MAPKMCQVAAVTGAPEALVTETPEVPKMVTGIPEAVEMEIPEAPTVWSRG